MTGRFSLTPALSRWQRESRSPLPAEVRESEIVVWFERVHAGRMLFPFHSGRGIKGEGERHGEPASPHRPLETAEKHFFSNLLVLPLRLSGVRADQNEFRLVRATANQGRRLGRGERQQLLIVHCAKAAGPGVHECHR